MATRSVSDENELTLAKTGARGLMRTTLLFSVFTNLLMLTGPLFMLQIYDRVLGSRSEETLVALTGLVTGLFLLYGLIEYARGRVLARAGARFQSAKSDRVFRAALEARAKTPGAPGADTALADLTAVRTFLSSPALLALFDLPWTPVFLLAIFIFHPILGWFAIIGGSILIFATVLNQWSTQKARQNAEVLSHRADRASRDAAVGAPLAWAQGMSGTLSDRWSKIQNEALGATLTAQDRTGGFSSFTRAFRFFLQSAILAIGAWLVLAGEMTGGAMIAGSILLGRALAPVEQTIGQWQVVQRARTGYRRLREFLNRYPEPRTYTTLPVPEARLTAKNLAAIIAPGQPALLQGVSFEVNPGEAVGVIGKSGAGKSTLARLVTGLSRPAGGEVRLGGATLGQYGNEALGEHVGYLPQHVHLFEGTIAENIARMSETPDPAEVVEAAQRARVHEIILKLPDGYDTQLVADDPRLSGGQKQRIALARALYGNPVLLVLDEPNSALDAEGSEALNAAIDTMKEQKRAVLVMTHRPTAIASCDRLLVLDEGKVVAYGPRDDVIRSTMRNANAVGRVVGSAGR